MGWEFSNLDSELERKGVARRLHVANIIKKNTAVCSTIEARDEELNRIKALADSLSADCVAFVKKAMRNDGFTAPDFRGQLKVTCGYHPLLFRCLEPGRRSEERLASLRAGFCPDGGFHFHDIPGQDEFAESMNYDRVNAIWGVTTYAGNTDESQCDDGPPPGDQCGHRALAILMGSAQRWVTFVVADRA